MKKQTPAFTSALSRREALAVLCWLPVHLVLLPLLLSVLAARGQLTEPVATFLCYALSFLFLIAATFRFLRRDFDPLAERPLFVAANVFSCYLLMLAFNGLIVFLILRLLPESENPNNANVTALVARDLGPMKAALIFLAPVVEELLFRAGLFGLLRRRNRVLAYAVSTLLFALGHVLSYALSEPAYWLYLIEYLPAGFLLARCYERSNSIWGSIFFHMLVNGVAVSALSVLQQ